MTESRQASMMRECAEWGVFFANELGKVIVNLLCTCRITEISKHVENTMLKSVL